MSSSCLEIAPDPFASVLGPHRGRGGLLRSKPSNTIISDDGIELELVTGHDNTPTKWTPGYKWMITGTANGPDEEIGNHEADETICVYAKDREIRCFGDSESEQMFLYSPTYLEATLIVDIAYELGLAN